MVCDIDSLTKYETFTFYAEMSAPQFYPMMERSKRNREGHEIVHIIKANTLAKVDECTDIVIDRIFLHVTTS